MKKSTLSIRYKDTKTIIKKRIGVGTVIMCLLLIICTAILPFIFVKADIDLQQDLHIFIISIFIFLALVISNAIAFIKLLFGKVVLDEDNKKIIVYNPFKHEKLFRQVAKIESIVYEGDSESADRYEVEIIFVSGKPLTLSTESEEQAKELVARIKSSIFPNEFIKRGDYNDYTLAKLFNKR